MKKYILLKDYSTPDRFIPAGTVLEAADSAGLVYLINGVFFATLSYIESTEGWFDEVREEKEPAQIYMEVAEKLHPRIGHSPITVARDLEKKYDIFHKANPCYTKTEIIGADVINVEIPDGIYCLITERTTGRLAVRICKH